MKRLVSLLHVLGLFVGISLNTVSAEQSCLPPDVPVKGRYYPKKTTFLPGDTLTYACKDDYMLLGKEVLTCKTNGAWSSRIPFCDRSAKLRNPRVENYNSVIHTIVDGDSETCFSWVQSTSHSLLLDMDEPAVVTAIRLYLESGTANMQVSICDEKKICTSTSKYLVLDRSQWVEIHYKDGDMIADTIKISNKAGTTDKISVCEIEIYVKDEGDCEYPPDFRIDNGYFEVSRNKATLVCEKGYKSGNTWVVCEKNTWKASISKCEEEVQAKAGISKIVICAVAAVVVIIILLLLTITICLIKKQRNREVVVVFKPSSDCSTEPEYATPYYEKLHYGVPVPPNSPRPALLPTVLDRDFNLPENCNGTLKKPMPADVVFGTLKKSTLYGR